MTHPSTAVLGLKALTLVPMDWSHGTSAYDQGQTAGGISSTFTDTCRVTTRAPRVAVTKKLLVVHLSATPGVPRMKPVFPVEPDTNHPGKFVKAHETVCAGSPLVAENA